MLLSALSLLPQAPRNHTRKEVSEQMKTFPSGNLVALGKELRRRSTGNTTGIAQPRKRIPGVNISLCYVGFQFTLNALFSLLYLLFQEILT
jgi:hypothetical protein